MNKFFNTLQQLTFDKIIKHGATPEKIMNPLFWNTLDSPDILIQWATSGKIIMNSSLLNTLQQLKFDKIITHGAAPEKIMNPIFWNTLDNLYLLFQWGNVRMNYEPFSLEYALVLRI